MSFIADPDANLIGLMMEAVAGAKIICPDAKFIAPCTCNAYGANVVMHAPMKENIFAAMNCAYKELDDATVSGILHAYLSTPNASPLRYLALDNNKLTKIPEQIIYFTRLNYLLLNKNKIDSLTTGSLKFGDTLWHLGLAENPLFDNLQPGVFVPGGFGFGSSIHLNHVNITRFESAVFEPLLKQLEPYGYPTAYLNVAFNPFDCESDPCHLGWLLRDQRQLLKVVLHARCSNGISFDKLTIPSQEECDAINP